MGEKTRGNHRPGGCLRFDCINRNIKCDDCIKVEGKETEYENKTDQRTPDIEAREER